MLAEYREKLPTYEGFAATCKELIELLLSREGVRVHSVTCRAKTPESLRGKLGKGERQCEALSEVTDLAGIRIITYFSDDVDAIARIIEQEFTVIPGQSIDKRKTLEPDQFGYLSVHYVCRVPRRRTCLPEYATYSGYICEIQVRSILQHAWAEIEHDLGYKTEQAIPKQIRRRFSRLAGLLETGDEQFMVIRDEVAAYASEVKRDITEKPSEVLLDKVSLAAFIDQDKTVRRIDEHLVRWVEAELAEPDDHFVEQLVDFLRDVGINTIEDVLDALTQSENVIVRQWQLRLAGQKLRTLRKGISLFHLWEVLLAEKGDLGQMVAAFDKFHLVCEGEQDLLEIIEAVRKASGDEAEAQRKRSKEA
jgi:ppGpp synthetase/RelA/SpoT-type nucleotidyltranferase